MQRKYLIVLFILLTHWACKKDNPSPHKEASSVESIIRITKNSELYEKYKYTNSKAIYYKDYSGEQLKTYHFQYDSSGLVSETLVKDEYENILSRYEYRYNKKDSLISSISIYKMKDNDLTFIETKELIYDSLQRLTKIEGYLPETFAYQDKNVIKHGEVSNDGIWTDYTYSHDNKSNILSEIGVPLKEVKFISHHNILSKTAKWDEYIDIMEQEDTTNRVISKTELVYSSTFEYNSKRLPQVEYRKYSDRTDTLNYFYE